MQDTKQNWRVQIFKVSLNLSCVQETVLHFLNIQIQQLCKISDISLTFPQNAQYSLIDQFVT